MTSIQTIKCHNLGNDWIATHFDKRLETEKVVCINKITHETLTLPKLSIETLRAIMRSVCQ